MPLTEYTKNMKYMIALFLIGFVGLAASSVFGMHINKQNHNGICIVATAQGASCPDGSGSIDNLTFHLNVFKIFSAATPSSGATFFSIFSLLVAGVAIGKILEDAMLPKFNFAYKRLQRPDVSGALSQRETISWLALHENSPAVM